MNKKLILIPAVFFVLATRSQTFSQKLYPVSFSEVTITDPFWKPGKE